MFIGAPNVDFSPIIMQTIQILSQLRQTIEWKQYAFLFYILFIISTSYRATLKKIHLKTYTDDVKVTNVHISMTLLSERVEYAKLIIFHCLKV